MGFLEPSMPHFTGIFIDIFFFCLMSEYVSVIYKAVIHSDVLFNYPCDSVSLFNCWWISPRHRFLLWYEPLVWWIPSFSF